jgi:hypothetical protein
MDRFQILNEEDPFLDLPNGDSCKYKIHGQEFIGWRIDERNLIISLKENFLKYLSAYKNPKIEIYFKEGKIELFEIDRLISADIHKKNFVKAQFCGKVLRVAFPGLGGIAKL